MVSVIEKSTSEINVFFSVELKYIPLFLWH